MRWIAVLLVIGCTSSTEDTDTDTDPVEDTGPRDTGVLFSLSSYDPCLTDAQCPPGDACTQVPGYGGLYCAPACDPSIGDESCLAEAPIQASCLPNGRCARDCDSGCPEGLECQEAAGFEICAGAWDSPYQTCTDVGAAKAWDCPGNGSCFYAEGSYPEGVGICVPWCVNGTCPHPGLGIESAPTCLALGFVALENCFLLCDPEGENQCPPSQYCQLFGTIGACVPYADGGGG